MSTPEPLNGIAGSAERQAASRGSSPFRRSLRRLALNRMAMGSLAILAALYVAAAGAGFLAPYHFDDERRDLSYHPPISIRIVDAEGRWRSPFVYATKPSFDPFYRRVFEEDRSRAYPIRLGAGGRLFGVEEPARLYLLGADSRGRDLFSRMVYGGRVSLTIGLLGVAVSFSIGLIVGGLAGYFGGWIDEAIMRACEMIMMAPGFYMLLALRAAFPPEMSSVQVYLLIVVILSFIGWAGLARVIRGMTISLRERQYVTAARAAGQSHVAIILGHLLPNTTSYALIAATMSVPGYILGESALSLLGLGIQDPHASWGNLLSEAMNVAQVTLHPWVLWPGALIMVAVMAYNFLGDGLRDAFDPHAEVIRR